MICKLCKQAYTAPPARPDWPTCYSCTMASPMALAGAKRKAELAKRRRGGR